MPKHDDLLATAIATRALVAEFLPPSADLTLPALPWPAAEAAMLDGWCAKHGDDLFLISDGELVRWSDRHCDFFATTLTASERASTSWAVAIA